MELVSAILLYFFLAFTFFFHFFFLLINKQKWGGKLPPGPWPLPLVGNLIQLGDKPHKSLAELAKFYGPIMTVKLGEVTTVVISSPTIAKQVLQKQDLAFSSRYVPNAIFASGHHNYSVMWLPVLNKWRILRKVMNTLIFSANRLDNFNSQQLRRQKVHALISYVEKCCQEGVCVDIGQVAFTTSLNILSNTIFSLDFADLNKNSSEYRDLISNVTAEVGKPNLVNYFYAIIKAIAKIDIKGVRHRMTVHFENSIQGFRTLVDERIEKRRWGNINENDMLDAVLNISQERPDDIDRTHIERLIMDLFIAGTDTTSSTIEWAMAELITNPRTLKMAQKELGRKIGRGKIIEESDLTHLPYLQAIVKETMRKHPPAPLLLPRRVEKNVDICGYIIPEGSQVLVNVWAMGRDSTLWVKPGNFLPERFLNKEIDFRGRDFELIPFGAGRRICPGLPLATRVVPLVLGSLLNLFNWKIEGNNKAKEIDMEEKFGITLQKAKPLRLIAFHG